MKRFGSLLGGLLAVLVVNAVAPALDLPDGRAVLLHAENPSINPRSDSISFTFDNAAKGVDFAALCVEGDWPQSGFGLAVNGQPTEMEPIYTKGKVWWQLPIALFGSAENELSLSWTEHETPLITTVTLFPLESSVEEVHFGRLVKGTPKAQPPVHPEQYKIDVQHCDLTLALTTASRAITGSLIIDITPVAEDLSQLVLDFNNNSGAYNITSAEEVTGGKKLNQLPFTMSNNRVYVTLSGEYKQGETYSFALAFSGTPADLGSDGYVQRTHSGVPVIFSQSQPYYARTWWPCKDIPQDKFTLDSHYTVPEVTYNGYPLFVASNGKLLSTVDNGSTVTYNWQEAYPVASYLVSFAASNYRPSAGTYTALDGETTMEVAHYVYPESFATESGEVVRTIEVIEFFADTFGEYPFLTEKYWTATWGLTYGMEHQTCTSMPNGNLSTAYHRRNIHELSHMWFGDAITCEHYDHLWLNEGWATYCEALFYEHKNINGGLHGFVAGWNPSDSYPIVSSNADSFPYSIVYTKAAWVLHMLRHQIGDTAFFAGAKSYLQDPDLRYSTALSDDLREHFETASGRDLTQFFTQWLYRARRPSYEWSWAQNGDDLVVGIRQTDTANQTVGASDVYEMLIDLQLSYAAGGSDVIQVNNTQPQQTFTIPLSGSQVSDVLFDPENWILDYATEVQPNLPDAPELIAVRAGSTANSVVAQWEPVLSPSLVGYRVLGTVDGEQTASVLADENVLGPDTVSFHFSIPSRTTMHIALVAVGEMASAPSDTYSIRIAPAGTEVLIVDGYDRLTREDEVNHDYATFYGHAVGAAGVAFDTCANEAVGVSINLDDYPVVVWMCGEDSTIDETFSDAEQALVKSYLENGGRLFVSGNEIAWDLDWRGQESDQAFLHNYLKATFSADNSNEYSLTGAPESPVFSGANYSFGGDPESYYPRFPDVLLTNGSDPALYYGTGTDIAGIEYFGTFGSSTKEGALFYFGFAFETLNTEAYREDAMERILNALLTAESGTSWMIY